MKNPSTTNTTHLSRIVPALALLALATAPSASAALTVFSPASGDFNTGGNWNNLLPGQDGPANQQAVIQNLNRTATTSGDYTNADDPGTLLNDYSLVVRSDAILNIGHNLSTSATDTNTGIVYLGFDAGGGTINHTAGTLTTGSLNIGGFAANGTRTADYNISGTADIDANSIQIRAADNTRRGRLLVGDGVTLDEAITVFSGWQGSITGTGTTTGGTLTGQITLQSGADFRGNNMTLSGGIVSAANQGISINGNNWTIDTTAIDLGTGTLTLTSAGNNEANATELNVGGNDWGTARINFGGYLKLGVDNAMPIDAGVEFGWSSDGASSGTLDLNGTDQTVAFLRQTTNYPTVNGDQNITGGGTLTIDTAAGTYDYHGRITDGLTNSMSIVKNGVGTQIFDNHSGTASDYTGTTTINDGVLEIRSSDALGSIAGGTTVNSGATVELNYGAGSISEAFTIHGAGDGGNGAIHSTGGSFGNGADILGVITLGSDATIKADTRIDHGNQITDGGGGFTLTKTGAASFVTGSAANYSNLVVNEGEFLVTTSAALPGGAGTSVTVNNGGRLTLWADGPNFSDVRLTLNDGAFYDANKNVAGSSSIDGTIAASGNVSMRSWSMDHTVNSDISGGGNLTLTSIISNQDSANYTFNGANTYTGTTTIGNGSAGVGKMTLVMDGTHTGGGQYTVTANSTLAGSGSFDAIVEVNGVISPGNSPGTMATGTQTWNNGGSYLWEINDSATWPDGAGKGQDPGWDWLDITGTLELGSLSAGGFTIDIDSWSGGGLGEASGFDSFIKGDGIFDYEFVIATASGGIQDFSASLFSLDDIGFTNFNPQAGWYWEVAQSGANDLVLRAFAVPEPSSTALLGLGLSSLLLRRKRS